MHAARLLQGFLGTALGSMHALRRAVLCKAVTALVLGRRLTMMGMARAWPGAERVRAPLKCLDRLLGNRHLLGEMEALAAAKAPWLLRGQQPVVVVDWSDLKGDGRWCVLRAGVALQGRTLTLYERVLPLAQQGSPAAQRSFLQALARIVPKTMRPILVTDAGFRSDWFRAVEALGWGWIGRLRNNTLVRSAAAGSPWIPCKSLYAQPARTPRELGWHQIVRGAPWDCRLVLCRKAFKARHALTLRGTRRLASYQRKVSKAAHEPWLLVVSRGLTTLSAGRIVACYARRMQIEQSFRDLKSHQFGHGFEDSLTRLAPRLEIMLLIHALALFVAWLVGLQAQHAGYDRWLAPNNSSRQLYSLIRVGGEAIARGWIPVPTKADIHQLKELALA